jgi:hypothetical protein
VKKMKMMTWKKKGRRRRLDESVLFFSRPKRFIYEKRLKVDTDVA